MKIDERDGLLSLRIVHRPRQDDGFVVMEIIAIGPTDKDEIYRMAVRRSIAFFDEMGK